MVEAKEAYKLLKENVVTGLSIGYRVKESHRDKKSGVRILSIVDLLEVSLVTFPANEQARVIGVKRFFDMTQMPSEREFETFLHGAGFSRKQAKGVVAKGYRAVMSARAEDGVTGAAEAEAEAKEVLRLRASIMAATDDNRKAVVELSFPPEKKEMALQEALYRFSVSLRQATAENEEKYNRDQPRSPSGSPDGGQWTDGGSTQISTGTPRGSDGRQSGVSAGNQSVGGAGNGTASRSGISTALDTGKAAQHAVGNVDKVHRYGDGKCARNTVLAVEAGIGYKIPQEDLPPPTKIKNPKTGGYSMDRAARDYGKTLEKVGFDPEVTVKEGTGDLPNDYMPEVGDVAVIQPPSDEPDLAGHMAIYTREGWVSDFKQRTFYPGPLYRDKKPGYQIYRHSGKVPNS